MKKRIALLSFMLAVMAATPVPVLAQDFFKIDQAGALPGIEQSVQKPKATDAYHIAMLFHRMTGKPLDFDLWAKQTKRYADASEFDQISMVDETAREIQKQFNLISFQDPIYAEYTVQLGKYSEKNGGYLVRNFDDKTHFSFEHLGEHYALIPKRISERQFINVTPASAELIERNIADFREIKMTMTLLPQYGDSSSPVEIDGVAHWLMLGDVAKMEIWDKNGQKLLWESVNQKKNDEVSNKLQDLYR